MQQPEKEEQPARTSWRALLKNVFDNTLAIEHEWQTRFAAAKNSEIRADEDGDEWEYDETRITNADDLAFLQAIFKELQYWSALGEDGHGADEMAALALGGHFPPPPPSRFSGEWLTEGPSLHHDENESQLYNPFGWYVWCGPSQGFFDAERK